MNWQYGLTGVVLKSAGRVGYSQNLNRNEIRNQATSLAPIKCMVLTLNQAEPAVFFLWPIMNTICICFVWWRLKTNTKIEHHHKSIVFFFWKEADVKLFLLPSID